MADSTMDTNGLSVASRIRMFQNNLEGDAPPKPKRGISPSGSPKPELTSQPSGGHIGTQILPINATKFAEKIVSSRKASPRQATPQSASPRSSPPRTESPAAIRHKGRDLNLDLKPIRNQTDTQKGQKSPRPSPKPSPRPSPQLERKEFIHADSQKSNKEAQHSNEAKQSVSRTTSQELTKPPLPNKPKSLVIKEGQTKDINDSCNAKSALSGKINKPDYPKKPLVVTVSSGNSTVDEDRNNSKEGREQKAVSEAPSRPLPFGPKSQADGINQHSFSEDAIAEKTEISDAKRKRDDMAHHSYEIVDRVYEEPDSPVQEEEVRYDNEYEDPGPCSPTESTQSSQFNDGDRKVLSRISTSRRPPPLPIQNRRDSKKNAKAPPLPSRNAVHTAEDQALYSYAAEPELFHAKAPSFKSTMQDLSYETPDAGSVRGLMLGLQNNRGDYETPDAASVNEFMSNVNANTRDGCNDYETPDQEAVRDLTCSIQDKKHVAGAYVGSDSDSDAYCDPETVPTLAERPRSPTLPLAPQKSLPPPPPGEGSDQDTSDEDHGHDYEDPTDDLRNRPRHVSLRRASQPVLNPDAYLSLQEMDLDSLYQDPAEAFSTMPRLKIQYP